MEKKFPFATFFLLTTLREAENIISLSNISSNILTSIVRRHPEEESLEHTNLDPRLSPALTLPSQKNLFKVNKKAKLQSISGGISDTPRTLPMALEPASSGVLGDYRQERKCSSIEFTRSVVGKKEQLKKPIAYIKSTDAPLAE